MSEPECSFAKVRVSTKNREGAAEHTSFFASEPYVHSGILRLNAKILYKIVSGVAVKAIFSFMPPNVIFALIAAI